MNRSHFDQIIDNYAARFVELNIGDNNEVYKWVLSSGLCRRRVAAAMQWAGL